MEIPFMALNMNEERIKDKLLVEVGQNFDNPSALPDPDSLPEPEAFTQTEMAKFPWTEMLSLFDPCGFLSRIPDSIFHSIASSNSEDYYENPGSSTGPASVSTIHNVLSIDLIFEKIFRSLPSTDLLKCRLLNHRWNSFATSELLRNSSREFYQVVDMSKPDRMLEFTKLLRQHSSDGILASLPFPCSQFIVETTKKSKKSPSFVDFMKNELTQEIFDLHGAHIRQLSLNFYINMESDTPSEDLPDETEVMEEVEKLLVHQVPNLFVIQLDIDCLIGWDDKIEGSKLRSPFTPLRSTDPEFKEIHSKNDPTSKNKNFSLKQVSVPRTASAKLLEMVILLAPNLKEIIADEHFHICLLEPLNRLHFLKRLFFFPVIDWHLESLMKAFEEIAVASDNGTLKIREIFIKVPKYGLHSGQLSTEKMRERHQILNMINRVLRGSWDSIEVFGWSGVTFHPELKFPQVMPRVKRLQLSDPQNLGGGKMVFLPGRTWAETFPNLQSFSMCDLPEFPFHGECVSHFIKCANLTQMKTVKEVVIWTRQVVPKMEMKKLRTTVFPNAKVRVDDGFNSLRHLM